MTRGRSCDAHCLLLIGDGPPVLRSAMLKQQTYGTNDTNWWMIHKCVWIQYHCESYWQAWGSIATSKTDILPEKKVWWKTTCTLWFIPMVFLLWIRDSIWWQQTPSTPLVFATASRRPSSPSPISKIQATVHRCKKITSPLSEGSSNGGGDAW